MLKSPSYLFGPLSVGPKKGDLMYEPLKIYNYLNWLFHRPVITLFVPVLK